MSSKTKVWSLVLIAVVFGWLFADQCLAGQPLDEVDRVSFTATEAEAAAAGFDFGPAWTKVAEGVWERTGKDGAVYHRIAGESGLRWQLDREREKLVSLLDENAAVVPGMEDKARAVLDKIRFLEGDQVSMAATKSYYESDSGVTCSADWSLVASCGTYNAYAFSQIDGPTCNAVAKAEVNIYSNELPAGVHDSESDYVSGGSGETATAVATQSLQGTGIEMDGYASAWFYISGGWYKVSVECERP